MSKADNKELEEAVCRINSYKDTTELSNRTCVVNKQDLEILLKELKKLQEENDELKFKERSRIIGKYEEMELHEVINETLQNDYIEKDKIKEIIENEKINISGLEVITVEDLEELLEGK